MYDTSFRPSAQVLRNNLAIADVLHTAYDSLLNDIPEPFARAATDTRIVLGRAIECLVAPVWDENALLLPLGLTA